MELGDSAESGRSSWNGKALLQGYGVLERKSLTPGFPRLGAVRFDVEFSREGHGKGWRLPMGVESSLLGKASLGCEETLCRNHSTLQISWKDSSRWALFRGGLGAAARRFSLCPFSFGDYSADSPDRLIQTREEISPGAHRGSSRRAFGASQSSCPSLPDFGNRHRPAKDCQGSDRPIDKN
jgi:hypothetical protein